LSVIHGKNIQVTLPNGKKVIGKTCGLGEEGELMIKTILPSSMRSEILKISAANEIRLQ
jgi:hypothetical protein